MRSKFLLTERNVNKTFISGLRLSPNEAESNPHKESNLVDINSKLNFRKIDFDSVLKERNVKDEVKTSRNINRFKNNPVDLKYTTQIEFNDYKTELDPRTANSKNISQLSQSMVEERTLNPSSSQLIRIKALNGSNPATLYSQSQISNFQKTNKVPMSKQNASTKIHNSGGMKISLKSDQNCKAKEEPAEKIVNYSATIIKGCDGMTEKKKTIKTFRHLFVKDNKIGTFLY